MSDWIEQHPEQFEDTKKVGVFVNAELDQVLNNVHDFQLDYVQLHGYESPEYCSELLSFWASSSLRSAKLIKAFSIDSDFDFTQTAEYEGRCAYFLFDTKGADFGGNGVTFDWTLLDQYQGATPFLLSGGIDLGMEVAIRSITHPQFDGVDINSRFEIEPGLKDIEKIQRFVEELNQVPGQTTK